MSAPQAHQPTLNSVAPRFLVGDMEQALAFYGQLGFASTYHDEGFAIIERDRIALQFNVSDPIQEPPQEGCRVCYIRVTHIEALYQQYVPTGALRSPIQATSWGTKGFWLCDPFRNILIFEESIPGQDQGTE
jgi:catechol 2,3-dioxygenase-like lactoylglutathione lyase family enzyme